MRGVNDMKLLARRNNRRNYGFAVACTAALLVVGVMAWAQTPAKSPNPDAPDLDTTPIIRTTVSNLVAPVLVTDHNGNIVDGLQANQFHLYDNGIEQNIQMDAAYPPVSLVVAIEKSSRVDGILPQLHKLGTLLTQITGKSGETAVLAFDCRIQNAAGFHNRQRQN